MPYKQSYGYGVTVYRPAASAVGGPSYQESRPLADWGQDSRPYRWHGNDVPRVYIL